MRKVLSCLSLSVLAGFLIGLGGFTNLFCVIKYNNPVAGAIFFCAGLTFVCFLSCNLFTGKVGYIFENKLDYSLNILLMIVGNMIGATLIGLIFMYTNTFDGEALANFINAKIVTNTSSYNGWMLFLRSILAGICVFLAVEAFKKFNSPVSKIIGIVFAIGTMVLIGAEHSVANCFYFIALMKYVPRGVGGYVFSSLLISILGNIAGSLIFWGLFAFSSKILKKE